MVAEHLDKAIVEDYVREAAIARGIDPDIAAKVARQEGIGHHQSTVFKDGRQEPSYGPFQLLIGGSGTGYPTGLGNAMIEQTGVDPSNPSNWRASVDFALNNVAKGGWGPWYGAKAVGITGMEGVGPNAKSRGVTMNSTPVAERSAAAPTPSTPAAGVESSQPPAAGTTINTVPVAVPPVAAPVVPEVTPFENLKQGNYGKAFSGLMGSDAFSNLAQAQTPAPPPVVAPSGLGASMATEQASRAQAASQLMAQLLQKKGLSLSGFMG